METKKRITVLLGAGAVIEATNVSTASITKKIITECKGFKLNSRKTQSVVDYICKEYWETFGKKNPEYKIYSKASLDLIVKYVNFEDIYHVIELLYGYSFDSNNKEYTSAYKVFTTFKSKYSDIDTLSVLSSARKIINVINDIVSEYSEQFSTKADYFKVFLQSLEKDFTLNIFNLNYDSWCEQSLNAYDDGFRSIPGYDSFKRFSINDYRKSCDDQTNTIAHLHGSILMGDADLKRSDINRFAYEDDSECLYKYNNYEDAKHCRLTSFKSNSTNQAGESIFASNIITGLMKTDKLLWNPLMEYEHHFYRALTSNENLLIVGYGFPDKYINMMLRRFQSRNIDTRKVMLITKANEDNDWQPQIEPPLHPAALTVFTHLMFKNESWYYHVNFEQVQKGYYSSDNMAGLYTCGLKEVVEKYMDDVINFYK